MFCCFYCVKNCYDEAVCFQLPLAGCGIIIELFGSLTHSKKSRTISNCSCRCCFWSSTNKRDTIFAATHFIHSSSLKIRCQKFRDTSVEEFDSQQRSCQMLEVSQVFQSPFPSTENSFMETRCSFISPSQTSTKVKHCKTKVRHVTVWLHWTSLVRKTVAWRLHQVASIAEIPTYNGVVRREHFRVWALQRKDKGNPSVTQPHLFDMITSVSNHNLKSRCEYFTHDTQLFLRNRNPFLVQFCIQSAERSM